MVPGDSSLACSRTSNLCDQAESAPSPAAGGAFSTTAGRSPSAGVFLDFFAAGSCATGARRGGKTPATRAARPALFSFGNALQLQALGALEKLPLGEARQSLLIELGQLVTRLDPQRRGGTA